MEHISKSLQLVEYTPMDRIIRIRKTLQRERRMREIVFKKQPSKKREKVDEIDQALIDLDCIEREIQRACR